MPRLAGVWRTHIVAPLLQLLRQGVTPDRLALSVALGAGVAVIPILGVSTVLCALLALWLRLNMPAIQLVNYLMTPAQLLLVIPFLRVGERLSGAPRFPITLDSGLALLSRGVFAAVRVLSQAIWHATVGWLALTPFAAGALFLACRALFRRLAPPRPITGTIA